MTELQLGNAFLLGLAGSWHCAAMCGGFALGCRRGSALAAYLGGRYLGYAVGGLVVGGWGAWVTAWLGSKLVLGWAAGLLLLMGLARPLASLPEARNRFSLTAFLWNSLSPWLRQPGQHTRWLLGAASALFPCGLLYAAWLNAASTSSPLGGWLAMSAFFLGSLPGLLAPRWLSRQCPGPWVERIQSLAMLSAGFWMMLLALWPEGQSLQHSCEIRGPQL